MKRVMGKKKREKKDEDRRRKQKVTKCDRRKGNRVIKMEGERSDE